MKRPQNKPSPPSKEQILAFIGEQPGRVGTREIARAFGLKNADRVALKRILRELADEGRVESRRKKLHHPGTLPSVVLADIGSRDADGELIATPTEWDEEAHGAPPKIRVRVPRNARPSETAGVGDRALLRVEESGEDDEAIRHSGRVIKIVDRAKRRVLGIFRALPGGGGRLVPIDKKNLGREIAIPAGAGADAQDGDLVAVELAPRRGGLGLPTARVTEKLGSLASERAVSLIAINAHSIPDVFPPAALREAEAAVPAGLRGREDWRDIAFVTIDPPDAKDHDDAVHAVRDDDRRNPGGYVLSVAIADVAHYVQPGSALDREALIRGNSVYFPDRVVPMLPERISNDLCSLRPREDRPALAVRIVVAADGRKRAHSFHRVLMRSAARLSYAQAQAAIGGRADEDTEGLVAPVLEPLYAAYRALAKARDARGPLDLDLPERKILLKSDGTVDRVITPERLEAHRLIEECMILANVAAAETLERASVPLIYRVHDEPDPERVNALREFLKTLDISLPKGGALRAEQFNRVLERVKGRDAEKLVNEVVLRTQAQAEYAAENYGHFGLNLRRYAHFTSPIRRYADLVVHRGLIRAGKLGDGALPDGVDARALAEIAATISVAERRAMKAERETFDRLLAHFLADRVGATFDGRISGVTRAGLFVKLDDTGADGFIPARTVGNEYFRFQEDRHALIGDASGESYRLGDRVTVKLVEAAPIAGALRFELLSEGQPRTPARGRPSATGAAPRSAGATLRSGREARRKAAPMNASNPAGLARMNALAKQIVEDESYYKFPNLRPKDAATLILVDRSGSVSKVLLGKRHHGHKFMPGKFVFPGGGVEPADKRMAAARPLDRHAERHLMRAVKRPSPLKARALALAAIRETYEETGLLLGTREDQAPATPEGPWSAFAQAHIRPDLAAIHFVARAITPPRRPKRFDTRFFAADATAIAHRIDGMIGPDAELVELVWMPIGEARQLDMAAITGVALEELELRIAGGLGHELPVPFYQMLHRHFVRELL